FFLPTTTQDVSKQISQFLLPLRAAQVVDMGAVRENLETLRRFLVLAPGFRAVAFRLSAVVAHGRLSRRGLPRRGTNSAVDGSASVRAAVRSSLMLIRRGRGPAVAKDAGDAKSHGWFGDLRRWWRLRERVVGGGIGGTRVFRRASQLSFSMLAMIL